MAKDETTVIRITKKARKLIEEAHVQVIIKTDGEKILRKDTLEYVIEDFVKRNRAKK